ncbi:MAG TPA: amidoligase family protein [Kofleriaceae bacterium]|nr:amidoligase family protein [Kofleriaceae bacterium]
MIGWTIGCEIELLAPRGSSRRTLAEHYAKAADGAVRTFFHPQSEVSLVPDLPVFENLTLGFEALDGRGDVIACCVDDLTLIDDLDREHPPQPGWFRVVSDDRRLLELVVRTGRADAGPMEAVAPIAKLFGTEPEELTDGIIRVTDRMRSPIVIASRLPGERERPCEIVTPPIASDHEARLDALLGPARELGFTLPVEAATHIHFDGAPLRDARAFRNLVRLVATWSPALKKLVGTNPRCRRLGGWPDALYEVVEAPDFAQLSWDEAKARLAEVGLSKYCDVNVKNIVHDVPNKPTIEFRVLPGLRDTQPILAAAALFEGVLRLACEKRDFERERVATNAKRLLDVLPLDEAVRKHWIAVARGS